MSALKEFAHFITLNMANLAPTYARLLAEGGGGYEILPEKSRVASARKLLKAVAEACESGTADPLYHLFNNHADAPSHRWAEGIDPPQPLLEIEYLGQTLTPVVTNLDAGKFLWQALAELRATVFPYMESVPSPPLVPQVDGEESAIDIDTIVPPVIESEQKYKGLIDDLPIGIYRNTPGPEGHFLEANSAIVTMFEADSKEEFLKHNVSDLYLNPNDRKKFSERMLRLGFLKDEELRLKTLKGKEIWGSVSAVMKEDANGQVYFDGLIEDITGRKHAEEALRESEERYRLLLDASPDPIVTYDKEGQAIYVNPAFIQTFGWSEDELLGRRIDFVPEENLPETKAALERLFNEGKVLGFETRRLTKDGQVLDVQQSGSVFKDETGNIAGSIIFIRDITGRKRVEAERERLLAETENLAKELTILNQLGQILTTRLNIDQVVEETYQGASRLLDTSNFTIGLYDPEKEDVAFVFTTTESEADRAIVRLPVSEGLAGHIIRNRTSLLIQESMYERQVALGITPVGELCLSYMGVPLIVGDRVLGMMSIQSYTTPHAYSQHDQDLFIAVASQAAIALQNARQFEQAQARTHREQTIRQITEKMRAATSLEELVKTAAEELGQRLSAEYALVELGVDTPVTGSGPVYEWP